jgi:hypothetical protein
MSSTQKELEIFEKALKECEKLECSICREECKVLIGGVREIVLIRAGLGSRDREKLYWLLKWAEEASKRGGIRFECKVFD